MTLEEFFEEHPKIALAFSGGVDSSYLLYAASRCGADVAAYYVKSQFQPEFELRDAIELAHKLGVRMRLIEQDIVSCAEVTANPPDRCYYCKKVVFSSIAQAALADGYTVLLDGTNASDDAGDRPGMRALQELQVLSPLRLCGLTTPEIRRLSKEARLFTWDKPAYACLATRIPTGEKITAEKLSATESAEGELFAMGFTDFRVRWYAGAARLQFPAVQLPRVLERREEILTKLKKYYPAVLLDLEVRG